MLVAFAEGGDADGRLMHAVHRAARRDERDLARRAAFERLLDGERGVGEDPPPARIEPRLGADAFAQDDRRGVVDLVVERRGGGDGGVSGGKGQENEGGGDSREAVIWSHELLPFAARITPWLNGLPSAGGR